MCIIVAKPKNVKMPDVDTLRNCFDNNRHGAGYMKATGKSVEIRKGFMKWEEFEKAITAEGDLTDCAVVMHFRIATHGKVQPSCCHPFPVTDDLKRLGSSECRDTLCAAHNGVIEGMATSDNVSDTMAYIIDVLSPLRRLTPSLIYSEDALRIVEATLGSKMALLDASGELVTIGDFQEHSGVLYSNSSYTKRVTAFRSYSSVWDDYDDVYGGYLEGGQYRLPGFSPLPFEVCACCPEHMDCIDGLPYCADEGQALRYAAGYDESLLEEAETEERVAAVA